MVFPLVALAVLAFVVIKSLMGVVAHESTVPATARPGAEPASTYGAWSDDARSLLLPSAPDGVGADAATDVKTA